ncbi:MAG: ATP-dependent DNA helicase RecG, partial [Bacteroidota bacterium]
MKPETFLSTDIKFLKGVGPERATTLTNELNIRTFFDLLNHFPFRYVDRTKFYKIKEINQDMPFVQCKGKIVSAEIVGANKGKRLVAQVSDETASVELVWFKGIKWVAPKLKLSTEFIVFGKPSIFNGKYTIAHPEIEIASEENIVIAKKLQPVYSTGEKLKSKWLDSKGIWKLQRTLVAQINKNIPETLSEEILKKHHLISREEAYRIIHLPDNNELLQRAILRLKFDELFFLQLRLLQIKGIRKKTYSGFVFDKVGNYFNDFYNSHLPFQLTNAQKRTLKEIRADIHTGKQMNRLLQGDVGSGKTIVALLSMLLALDNNFQACLMAPTEILANQHFKNISNLLEKTNIHVKLLTGSTKKSERMEIHKALQSGELNILIGTHALIEEDVQFINLGFAVVDEQHKFGVAQRSKLWKKGTSVPHILVMTATPIPRTLAMTLYGDLDVSVIDELPPGRKPIKTFHRYET